MVMRLAITARLPKMTLVKVSLELGCEEVEDTVQVVLVVYIGIALFMGHERDY